MRQVINGVIGELDSLPGCTQVAVSHAVFVPEEERGKGRGKRANHERCLEAHRLGYDYILCTADAANTKQIEVLRANHWLCLGGFHSRKTGHWVCLYGRILT